MPEPTEFLALKNLQAALAAISVVGGYHFTMAATAVRIDPNKAETLIAPNGPRPFALIQVDPDTFLFEQANQLKVKMPVIVHWVSDSTPTDDDSRLQTYYRGCADVEQAINVDIHRGGLSTDTRITKRTFDLSLDGAQVWAQIAMDMTVRRTYGQPNQ